MTDADSRNPFTSPFEAGMRALIILAAAFPDALDLYRLVTFDYLTVHSSDAAGPESLHAPVPLRSGELLVRRGLVERGLLLMVSRGLANREFSTAGVLFRASEEAAPFIDLLTAHYTQHLKDRAGWVIGTFGRLSDSDLRARTAGLFRVWAPEFEARRAPGALL